MKRRGSSTYTAPSAKYEQALKNIIIERKKIIQHEGMDEQTAHEKLHRELPELWDRLHSLENDLEERALCLVCASDEEPTLEDREVRFLTRRAWEEFLKEKKKETRH